MSLNDNWATAYVEQCRTIWRPSKRRERHLEIGCIVGKFHDDPRGTPFIAKGIDALQEAIDLGLGEAADMERSTNAGRPTPAQACVAKICELLDVEYPPADA